MTSNTTGTHAIDLQKLLGKRSVANAAITSGLATVSLDDPSYPVAVEFLKRRIETARSIRTVGLASTALLVGLGSAFFSTGTPATGGLWILAAVVGALSVFASISGAADDRRITELQVRAALNTSAVDAAAIPAN